MRSVGRVSGWNDDKGYGFVVPHEGGTRAFVHVKAFQPGSRRPVDGDLVSYDVAKDARGRSNAVAVRFAGQRIERPAPRRSSRGPRLPRAALGGMFLLAVAVAAGLGRLPVLVPVVYVVLGIASYLAYGWDKAAAATGARRTPEMTLHLLDLLGGWPGALVAQQQFRHKTIKAAFQAVFWLTVAANLVAVAWLVRGGLAQAASAAVPGL